LKLKYIFNYKIKTYPAKEPPTHARHAGANAGAFPAFAAALSEVTGGGEGLLRIAK
jgi:hypothetical protein